MNVARLIVSNRIRYEDEIRFANRIFARSLIRKSNEASQTRFAEEKAVKFFFVKMYTPKHGIRGVGGGRGFLRQLASFYNYFVSVSGVEKKITIYNCYDYYFVVFYLYDSIDEP